MDRILVREAGGGWVEPSGRGYALEVELQSILSEHPELIPGVGRGALTCREFQSGAGPADIVVVEEDGSLTLVQCKLDANPQVRREIVGQMFDYASRLWKMDVTVFDARWRARTGSSFHGDGTEGETLRGTVARNLEEGRFRIVLAVDAINTPLKRMVEYLNATTGEGTSVIAAEYSRVTHGPLEILMPRIYGQELAEAKAASSDRDRLVWELPVFRDWIQEHEPAGMSHFEALIVEAESQDLAFVGSMAATPSGGFRVHADGGRRVGTLALFYFSRQGLSLEISLSRRAVMPVNAGRNAKLLEQFAVALGDIPGFERVAANLQSSGFTSRGPNVPMGELKTDSIRRVVGAMSLLQSYKLAGEGEPHLLD
jgi:hypothetical protein